MEGCGGTRTCLICDGFEFGSFVGIAREERFASKVERRTGLVKAVETEVQESSSMIG